MMTFNGLCEALIENLENSTKYDDSYSSLYMDIDFSRELSCEKVHSLETIAEDIFIFQRDGNCVVEVIDEEEGELEVIDAIGLKISKVDDRVKPDLIKFLNSWEGVFSKES